MLHKCNILKKQKKDEHDNLNYSPYHILFMPTLSQKLLVITSKCQIIIQLSILLY